MRNIVTTALFVIGAAGFSTAAFSQTIDSGAVAQITSFPSPGKVTTASVGSEIHEYGSFVKAEVATTEQPLRGGRWAFPITVAPGELLYSVGTRAAFKACTEMGDGPCALDDDGDGSFDRMAQDNLSIAVKLKIPVPYAKRTARIESQNSFRQVILYGGATADTLKLSYREFKNDLARPAFTEELTIPITRSFPEDVAIKNVVLRLHGIDGMGLKYEVVK